jgi:hypothetical protein
MQEMRASFACCIHSIACDENVNAHQLTDKTIEASAKQEESRRSVWLLLIAGQFRRLYESIGDILYGRVIFDPLRYTVAAIRHCECFGIKVWIYFMNFTSSQRLPVSVKCVDFLLQRVGQSQ